MPKITVGIDGGPSTTIVIDKPFDCITIEDVYKKIDGKRIVGWCMAND